MASCAERSPCRCFASRTSCIAAAAYDTAAEKRSGGNCSRATRRIVGEAKANDDNNNAGNDDADDVDDSKGRRRALRTSRKKPNDDGDDVDGRPPVGRIIKQLHII
jgi:hypothetical protein